MKATIFLFALALLGSSLASEDLPQINALGDLHQAKVPKSWFRAETVDQETLDLTGDKPAPVPELTASDNATLYAPANCGMKNGPRDLGLIVGGTEASPNSWPWAIGILKYGSFICGGTILNERYILTAAHCVQRSRITQPASAFQILVGAHNIANSGTRIQVERVIPHAGYDENYMQNDIALFRLKTPINFAQLGNKARPICLPPASMDAKNFAGQMSTAVGWGATREGGSISRTLQQVQIPIITNQQCARQYNPQNIRVGQICAAYPQGGKDSCQGDSGGSLTIADGGKFYQLGVVSWGSGCARPGAPGVYTRVTKQLSWIAQNMRA